MGNKLTIEIDIVLIRSNAECRNIDGNVEDTEEGECKH